MKGTLVAKGLMDPEEQRELAQIFIFMLSCGASKGDAFIKPFVAQKKKCESKNFS